ncbi:hypothetical protein ACKWTF_011731 [Chironomus riparius]
MLTKKEKLLIYPYQIKRFYQHRKNVKSAGPAIDFYPPTEFPHITMKLKKLQKESERQEKVNKDNIRLLQRLGSIMTTKRLKNFWDKPRPSFLNREIIPHLNFRSTASSDRRESGDDDDSTDSPTISRKKERIPWKPMSPTKNMKLLREADIKPHKCCKFCC